MINNTHPFTQIAVIFKQLILHFQDVGIDHLARKKQRSHC